MRLGKVKIKFRFASFSFAFALAFHYLCGMNPASEEGPGTRRTDAGRPRGPVYAGVFAGRRSFVKTESV